MRYEYNKEILEEVVKNSLSISEVCKKLDIKPAGGNYKTLKIKFNQFNISIEHFTGSAWNQGKNFKDFSKKQNLDKILIENSTYTNTGFLKTRLIKEGLKNNKCEICNYSEWLGLSLILELHHINGDSLDHRIENLQILCPNCHSQTKNFRRKKAQ